MSQQPKLEAKNSASGADTDIVFIYQRAKGAVEAPGVGAYKSVLDKLVKSKLEDGHRKGLHHLCMAGKGGRKHVLFIGLGKEDDLAPEHLRQIGALAWRKLCAEKAKVGAVWAEALPSLEHVQAFAEGMLLTTYSFHKYRTKVSLPKEPAAPSKLLFVDKNAKAKADLARALKNAEHYQEAMTLCRDWANEPSNFGTPEYFAAECKRMAKKLGIKCTVLNETQCKKEKMGLFLSVGAGSDREGQMVILDWNPKGAKKTVSLVGKGVTFDSGGISIKPSLKMEDMKHDMAGAATMAAVTFLAAMRKAKNRIVTVLAFTENMPSGHATQPGNIISGRNGKTVEIINTDAEGRLILADALDYAQDFKPDVVVNAATLTGACTVALGRQACAILGNDQKLVDLLRAHADRQGERMWQLPLWDEYFDDMKSDYADMRNSANDGAGGTIRGAIFLKQFIRSGMKWAHLDIANVAYDANHIPYHPRKGGTGKYVRTLCDFVMEY